MPARKPPRERLIAAAAELFSTGGYDRVSTAQIAAAAKASKETLYAHFGGKAGLLHAVLLHLVTAPEQPRAGAAEVVSSIDFAHEVNALAVDLVRDLTQPTYLALARIVVAETPRDPTLAQVFREAVAERTLTRAAALLEQGRRAHVVDRHVDSALAARALIGPLLTHVLLDGLLRPSGDVRPPSAETVAAHVELFLRSVRT